MELTRHPAKFTDAILHGAEMLLLNGTELDEGATMYDPFAGVGKGVEYMADRGFNAWGTELEPEWADQSELVECWDSLDYMRAWARNLGHIDYVDVVFTSPVYGNRMADHHDARDNSRRNTYRHALNRPLTDGSSAGMQWGDEYRRFHLEAWTLVYDIVAPGGYFLLNVKDHIRKGKVQKVSEWHLETCVTRLGFVADGAEKVTTPGNRQGQNGSARVDHEWLFLLRKPAEVD